MCASKTGYNRPLSSGMGIKHLQWAPMKRCYSSQKKTKSLSDPLKIKDISVVVAAVMRVYNSLYRETHKDQLSKLSDANVINSIQGYEAYTKIGLSQGEQTWAAKDNKRFEVELYKHTSVTLGPISSMLDELGVDEGDNAHRREHSYIFFLYRITKSADKAFAEIFALYTNEGYRPIQNYTDYTFSNKIALRLLSPITDRPHKESHKQIHGSVVAADAVVRPSEAYNPNQVGKVFTSFKGELKETASLRCLESLQTKDGDPAHINFEIKQGVVKINKALSLRDLAFIFDIFAKISAGEETFQTKKGKKTKTKEEDEVEAFKIYKYYTLVPFSLRGQLNRALAKEIAADVSTGKGGPDWELSPPKVSDFFGAKEFRLDIHMSQIKDPIIIGPWEGPPPTYRELIKKISGAIPNYPKDVLVGKVPDWKFCFRGRRGEWERDSLLSSVTGMKFTKEGQKGCYFHLHSNWYETTVSLLQDVATQFRSLLAETLIEAGEQGYLNRPWEPKSKYQTVKKTAADLGVTEKQLREACGRVVQWVGEDGSINFEGLGGDILTHPIISRYQEGINQLLEQEEITKDEVDEIAGIRYGKVIWEELTKERQIARIDKAKDEELVCVLNAFGWPDLFKKKQEKIEELSRIHAFTSDEGIYNEGYLYDVTNIVDGKPTPYSLKESGWLVGDRITRGWGIEIFDVLYFSNPKDKTVYLYHVKDGFNHVVRDACSQIVNSARTILDARQRNTKKGKEAETVLTNFYKEATKKGETKEGKTSKYRKAVRHQMNVIGKEGFLNLFRDREIVFVYAFVDDRVKDYQVRREEIKKEKFSEADFSCEKTKDVAQAIFKELKSGKYLSKSGGKGEKFPSLYKVENLTFADADLAKHREYVWNILVGGIGHFSSLIARMDLLQTRREVEGMGFRFKVCQIKRPYNLKGDSEKPSASWDGIDEDLSQDFQTDLMDETVLAYHNLWTNETEAWTKQPTTGDGSCSFHALLGQFDEEKKEYHVAEVDQLREDVQGELQDKLKDDGTAFSEQSLQDLYESNLRSMAKEASRSIEDFDEESPEYVLIECAQRLFIGDAEDLFSEYQSKREAFADKVKSILEDEKCKGSGRQMGAVRKKLGKGSKFTKEDACNSLEARGRDVFEAIVSIKPEGSYAWMKTKIDSAREALAEVESSLDDLVQSADVMDNFLDCIGSPNYWLSDDELQMVAEVRDLRVEIIRRDPSSQEGDFGCNNYSSQLPPGADTRDKVVVHASENHFSRCKLFS